MDPKKYFSLSVRPKRDGGCLSPGDVTDLKKRPDVNTPLPLAIKQPVTYMDDAFFARNCFKMRIIFGRCKGKYFLRRFRRRCFPVLWGRGGAVLCWPGPGRPRAGLVAERPGQGPVDRILAAA